MLITEVTEVNMIQILCHVLIIRSVNSVLRNDKFRVQLHVKRS